MSAHFGHHHIQAILVHHHHHHNKCPFYKGQDPGKVLRKLTKFCGPKPCCLFFIISVILTLSIIIIKLYYLGESVSEQFHPNGGDYFSLNTSIVFPLSGLFCPSFVISKEEDDTSHWDASVYILSKVPSLSDGYNFTIDKQENLSIQGVSFHKNSFYLRNGSIYTISSCVLNVPSPAVSVCILKGATEYSFWQRSKKCLHSILLLPCNPHHPNITYRNITDQDDRYYFIHYISNTTVNFDVHIRRNMSFQAKMVHIDSSEYNCTLPGYDPLYKCSTGNLSMTFKGVAILVITANETQSVDWDHDTIHIDWTCDPEYGAITLIMVLPMVFVCVIFIVSCVILGYCLRKRESSNYTQQQRRAKLKPSRKRCYGFVCYGFACVFPSLTLALAFTCVEAILPVICTTPSMSGIFIPRDTRIIKFNSFFCSGVSISLSGNSYLTASLYVGSKAPLLNDRSDIIISDTAFELNCGDDWCSQNNNLYLNQDSSVQVNICLHQGSTSFYKRIKGNDSFQEWLDSSYPHGSGQPINSSTCAKDNFVVKQGDYYFFIVFGPHNAVSFLDVSIKLNRTEYSIPNGSAICTTQSYGTGSCTVYAPYIGTMTALIAMSDSNSISDKITIDATCIYRAVTFVPFCLLVFILNFLIFLLMCFGYIKYLILRRKKSPEEKKAPSFRVPSYIFFCHQQLSVYCYCTDSFR